MCRFKDFGTKPYVITPKCFNTSYVSVQASHIIKDEKVFFLFQYIICVGSSIFKHMFPFQSLSVSIHHMCRFKNIEEFKPLCRIWVSIHHMCRFKPLGAVLPAKSIMFQYIICVGSRSIGIIIKIKLQGFNTSYVSVQV